MKSSSTYESKERKKRKEKKILEELTNHFQCKT
jgi:hypothetical protein